MTQILTFVECEACRAKDGSRILCDSCIRNRHVISELRKGSCAAARPERTDQETGEGPR